MRRPDISRIIFLFVCAFSILLYGIMSVRMDLFPYPLIVKVGDSLEAVATDWHVLLGLEPEDFLQPARQDGDGVTVNVIDLTDTARASDLIMISSFFEDQSGIHLLRRDGAIVAQWNLSYTELFPDTSYLTSPPNSDWNVDTNGALMMPDGSVVFNFEYAGTVSLDRCGDINWRLPEATHHSVVRAMGGGFWVPGRNEHAPSEVSSFPPYRPPFKEDTILKIAPDGTVEKRISVPGLLVEHGLEAIFTASGHFIRDGMHWDGELVHLNKIAELTADLADDFPLFEAGDLMISLRNINTIVVLDPETQAIKWWQTGPWIRQHDPEFQAGGKIVVFNNNAYASYFADGNKGLKPGTKRNSTILSIDPVTREVERLYGAQDGQEMLTILRGKVDLGDDGSLLMTEFEGGRAFEVDASGNLIWEYINRYSDTQVAEITQARRYPLDYFTVTDWTCENDAVKESIE